jgi:hypothetical protein
MNESTLSIALLCLTLAVSGQSSASEIHKWVDENGVVHFGDRAPENVQSEQIHLDEEPAPSARQPSSIGKRQYASGGQSSRNTQVTRDSSGESTDIEKDRRCNDVAQQLSVLEVALPTYRDQTGRFHNTANWQLDPYEGERAYLDDATREKEIAKKKGEIRVLCASTGRTSEELGAIGEDLRLRSEKCKIAKVELELALDPEFSQTQQHARDKARLVDEYCSQ